MNITPTPRYLDWPDSAESSEQCAHCERTFFGSRAQCQYGLCRRCAELEQMTPTIWQVLSRVVLAAIVAVLFFGVGILWERNRQAKLPRVWLRVVPAFRITPSIQQAPRIPYLLELDEAGEEVVKPRIFTI